MRTGRKLILAFLLLSGCGLLRADGAEKESGLLERLTESMRKSDSIQADFVQTKKIRLLDRELEIRGFLALDRSGKMAWHVLTPMRYSCIIDGKKFVQWDADSNAVLKADLEKNPGLAVLADSMRAYFSGDFEKLAADFLVSERDGDTLVCRPKKESFLAKFIESTILVTENARIRRIVITEVNGDVTTIMISRERINQPVPDGVWRVQPE